MAKSLRALIVEDSENDALLVVRELEKAGYDVKGTRVETAPAMRAALGQEQWDLIIADFTMPQFSAPAALSLLQEVGIDLPFIIVSGTVGEDIAVEAMKAGAHDYLVKGNLKRLAPAVQRELAEAANRRARQRAEESYRDLVALAPIGICRATREGRLISANVAFARILGYDSPDELLPLDMQADIYFDAADRPRLLGELERGGAVSRSEVRLKRKDGSPIWVEIDARAVRTGSGAFGHLEGFVHDIDQRIRMVEELRESEERFRRSFSVSPVAMTLTEWRTGRIIDANESLVRMLGYGREELIGRTSIELGLWIDVAERDRMVKAIEAEVPFRGREVRLRTRSGEIRYVLDSVEPLQLGGERVLLSVFEDVTERKRGEEALRASEERYRLLFENNPQPIWVFDGKTLAFLAVNEAACRHYGYSRDEFLGMTIEDIRPAEDVAALHHLLKTEARAYQESGIWRHRKKDGTVIEVEIASSPIEFGGRPAQLVLAQDVTERRQLEQKLRQAQKMEGIGQLAGGIAHDFNNLLTAILGYSDLLATQVGEQSPHLESIDEIRKAGERAASLTRQLLAFSRRQVLELRVLEVSALVADLKKMLGRLIGEDIELVTAHDPSAGRIRADAGQIEQVLMNLVINARDAMPGGGRITIETAGVELDETYARTHVTVRPGNYVMIAVTDTGTGMTAETRSHVFEPFFTTKGGKGTGLGLATVYGIVKQSGGYIWVYSEPGRGTSFKIYLPAVEEAADKLRAARPRSPARGTETVLLVEDEESVRTLSRTILEANGYTVLEAESPEEALAIARDHPRTIHLLLTDVVMPEMGGPDLASRIGAIRPRMKVLYMSGYTDHAVFRQGALKKGQIFLQKPFTPGDLARRVGKALEA
jgi:PAS domain S-box-containing protein